MRKILVVVLVLSASALLGCHESAGEKIERKVRNAADDIEDAVK